MASAKLHREPTPAVDNTPASASNCTAEHEGAGHIAGPLREPPRSAGADGPVAQLGRALPSHGRGSPVRFRLGPRWQGFSWRLPLPTHGGLAQLAERLRGTQEVI